MPAHCTSWRHNPDDQSKGEPACTSCILSTSLSLGAGGQCGDQPAIINIRNIYFYINKTKPTDKGE